MPKFYVYADQNAFDTGKWSVGSFLGLALTKSDAERAGLTIIYRLSDGKIWCLSEGKIWRLSEGY